MPGNETLHVFPPCTMAAASTSQPDSHSHSLICNKLLNLRVLQCYICRPCSERRTPRLIAWGWLLIWPMSNHGIHILLSRHNYILRTIIDSWQPMAYQLNHMSTHICHLLLSFLPPLYPSTICDHTARTTLLSFKQRVDILSAPQLPGVLTETDMFLPRNFICDVYIWVVHTHTTLMKQTQLSPQMVKLWQGTWGEVEFAVLQVGCRFWLRCCHTS